MLPGFKTLFNGKSLWRERLKPLRAEAAAAQPDAAKHAARYFLDSFDAGPADIVSLYYPIGDELDTKPLADALLERGVSVALPVVVSKKAPLEFRRFNAGDDLTDGAYGERIPAPGAPTVRPTIVVTPLLGFSTAGDRLGYGGGYYDRTLEGLRDTGAVMAVGFAYARQEVDALPVSPLDQRLDWIVTERGAVRCGP